jgi:hypothetical protein
MLKQFNSNSRKLNRVIPKDIKSNTLDNDAYITYLQSIADAEYAEHNTEIQKTTSRVRSNPNPTKLINNKSTISNFYKEILEYSARYVKRSVDSFSNDGFGTLTILNTQLDYGTEGASADNFELLVYGLNIPGDYSVKEVGNNVVITLNDEYIDFDNVTLNDIYVIGKLKDIVIGTEFDTILSTENDEEIIL